MVEKPVRHILSFSGGKDSTALGIYLRDRIPDLEYVFCDTGHELPETYDYIAKLEAYLGKSITVLPLGVDREEKKKVFENLLDIRGGFLPSPKMRWCTELLKLRPFEQYVGSDRVINYIGIRADEDRLGYLSHRLNIIPRYPFVDDGLTREDIIRILEDSGLGLPEYYKWRSRSGCYFCFFQQRIEWVGLLENHPDLYERAMAYERENCSTGDKYYWCERESLRDLMQPERIQQIKDEHKKRTEQTLCSRSNIPLLTLFDEWDDDERACLVCEL